MKWNLLEISESSILLAGNIRFGIFDLRMEKWHVN